MGPGGHRTTTATLKISQTIDDCEPTTDCRSAIVAVAVQSSIANLQSSILHSAFTPASQPFPRHGSVRYARKFSTTRTWNVYHFPRACTVITAVPGAFG